MPETNRSSRAHFARAFLSAAFAIQLCSLNFVRAMKRSR
jgi:hypothetical protein